MQGVETQSAFLVPADVPPDTAWNTERGWEPDTEIGSEGELCPERVLSDHRPLVVDFALSAPSS